MTRNRVVEFEENRRIAWHHFAQFVWRYELEEVEGGTMVTESFNYDKRGLSSSSRWASPRRIDSPCKRRCGDSKSSSPRDGERHADVQEFDPGLTGRHQGRFPVCRLVLDDVGLRRTSRPRTRRLQAVDKEGRGPDPCRFA